MGSGNLGPPVRGNAGPQPVGRMSFEKLFHVVRAWSEKTFGTSEFRGPRGPLKHLGKEIGEAIGAWDEIARNGGVLNRATPDAVKARFLEELVDVQILLFDALWRAEISPADYLSMAEFKMVKNINRVWPPPTPDGPVEHDRRMDPEALTLALLERELERWHVEKYGRSNVIPHATLAKLFEELGEFGEAVRNAQASDRSESLSDEVSIEAFDVLAVVMHLVRNYGGSLSKWAPKKLAVIFERLKPQPQVVDEKTIAPLPFVDGGGNDEIGGTGV